MAGRPGGRFWPTYRAAWRWHFYAGAFCIPFVVWLGLTGSVYLFKPQIDSLIDRPYDRPMDAGPGRRGTPGPAAEARAALAAVPGSRLLGYEMPRTRGAARVLVDAGRGAVRVYVHPGTLRVLKQVPEEDRFERIVFRLHGQLLLGNAGSVVVELAASWAVVLIATGLYLWWPRRPPGGAAGGLAGILYPRLTAGGRVFWRDLHAVTGLWISALALFLILSGLPWTYVWGNALKAAREAAAAHAVRQDWETGASTRIGGGDMPMGRAAAEPVDPAPLDRLVAAAAPLRLAYPAVVRPPAQPGVPWTVRSDAQDRTLRTTVELDPATGAVTGRRDFRDQGVVDRVVGIGVAAHEGQLFGWFNQLLGLAGALGLVLLGVSAAVLWWRRRPAGVLGAPPALSSGPLPAPLVGAMLALAVALPTFGASLAAVLLLERTVFRRVARLRDWLGLAGPA